MKRKETNIEIYKQIIGFIPDAIVLVTGGIVKEKGKDGKTNYRSTKISEGDAFGILWGEARVFAVVELAKYFPESKIIILGIPHIYKDLESPLISTRRLLLDKNSTNTLTQVVKALKIINTQRFRRIVFITSEYHIPRVQTIYENVGDKNKQTNIKIKFVAAETILPHINKKYIKIIESIKKSPSYLKRLQNEKRGLSMIKNNKYGKKETIPRNKLERVM